MVETTAFNVVIASVVIGATIFGFIYIGCRMGKDECEKRHGGPKNGNHW